MLFAVWQSEAAAHMQRAFAVSGYRGAIRQWAQEMEHLQATHQAFLPGNLAEAYGILGDKDRAFYWLEQAYDHREMVSFDGGVFFLGAEPMYDPRLLRPEIQGTASPRWIARRPLMTQSELSCASEQHADRAWPKQEYHLACTTRQAGAPEVYSVLRIAARTSAARRR